MGSLTRKAPEAVQSKFRWRKKNVLNKQCDCRRMRQTINTYVKREGILWETFSIVHALWREVGIQSTLIVCGPGRVNNGNGKRRIWRTPCGHRNILIAWIYSMTSSTCRSIYYLSHNYPHETKNKIYFAATSPTHKSECVPLDWRKSTEQEENDWIFWRTFNEFPLTIVFPLPHIRSNNADGDDVNAECILWTNFQHVGRRWYMAFIDW